MGDSSGPAFGWTDVEHWHERLPKMIEKADAAQTLEANLASSVFFAFGETTRLALEARKQADQWKARAIVTGSYESALDMIWAALHPGGSRDWAYAGQVAQALEERQKQAKAAEAEVVRLNMVLRGILEMTAEDIRLGGATSAACVWQVEGAVREALGSGKDGPT